MLPFIQDTCAALSVVCDTKAVHVDKLWTCTNQHYWVHSLFQEDEPIVDNRHRPSSHKYPIPGPHTLHWNVSVAKACLPACGTVTSIARQLAFYSECTHLSCIKAATLTSTKILQLDPYIGNDSSSCMQFEGFEQSNEQKKPQIQNACRTSLSLKTTLD